MIISRGRRYIFVHIPKTGGTAFSQALEAGALDDDILIGDTPKARARAGHIKGLKSAGRLWKNSTLQDIEGLLTAAEIESFFTVTLVRNPWDRLVSLYHWLRLQRFAHSMVSIAKTHSFSGFLNHKTTRSLVFASPYGRAMTQPNGIEHADLFIRIEAFAEDVRPFEAHLGYRLPPLPRLNTSDRTADWRPYYCADDATLVAMICGQDIARFGYRFDR